MPPTIRIHLCLWALAVFKLSGAHRKPSPLLWLLRSCVGKERRAWAGKMHSSPLRGAFAGLAGQEELGLSLLQRKASGEDREDRRCPSVVRLGIARRAELLRPRRWWLSSRE